MKGENEMTKIAIVGAGAMGCVLGAYLAKGGGDVVLVDPMKEHMDAIADGGLIMNSASGREVVKLKTAYNASEIGIQDYVVIMVKGTLTEIALDGALPAIGDSTYVCTFQNGFGNVDTIAKKVPEDKILYGCLNMASLLKGPGEVYGNLFGDVHVHVGSIVREEAQVKAGELIAKTFTDGGAVSNYDGDDIDLHVWNKALINISVNASLGLVRLRGFEATDVPAFQKLLFDTVDEVVKISKVKGIVGLDTETFLTVTLPDAAKTAGDHYPSMAQDILMNKKRTEIEFLNGAVQRMGAEVGIPTPVNETIANLVRTIELKYDLQYNE
jgi:2-dehydropantoate 2-reductase